MKSNSTIAKRLATQMWGKPDHQHKLADGIWEFSTPRHGGIIVDIEVRPLLREYVIRSHTLSQVCHGLLNSTLQPSRRTVMLPLWNGYTETNFTINVSALVIEAIPLSDKVFFEEAACGLIKESLKRWHPEVLEKWPEPYVDKGKKHAAWLDRSTCENLHWVYWTECSACGNPLDKDLVSNPPSECPHCGAIMLEKEPKR